MTRVAQKQWWRAHDATRQDEDGIASTRRGASRLSTRDSFSAGLTIFVVGILTMSLVACDKSRDSVTETSVLGESNTRTIDEPVRSATSAYLEWDAVPYPILRGYRVYYGPDPEMYLQLPGQGIDVGNVTAYEVTGLVSGRRYYFAVTAVDYSGNESELSEQVYKDIP